VSGPHLALATAAIERLPEPAWIVDAASGRITCANPAARSACGPSSDTATIGELLDPGYDEERWAAVVDRLIGAEAHPLSSRLRTLEEIRPVRLWLTRHAADRSDEADVVLVISELIPRTAADPTADQSWTTVAEILDEGVALVDASGRITSVNAAFCRLVSQRQDQILDRSVHDPPWDLVLEDGSTPDPRTTAPVTALRKARSASSATMTLRHVRGERPWFSMIAHPLPSSTPAPAGVVIVLRDQTTDRETAATIDRLAGSDPLTGLASRARIVGNLKSLVENGEAARSGIRTGVLHVDVDDFRTINESFSTSVGDVVLVQLAARLRDLGDRGIEIGRIGVDEFLVVLTADGASLAFDSRLRGLAEEIQRRLSELFRIDDLTVRLTASVGVARSPGDANDAEGLMLAASRAVAASRTDSRHSVEFPAPSGGGRVHRGLAVDAELRSAVAQHDLDIHYQPLVDLRTGSLSAAEALLRWHHPQRGPIPPSVFIPAAEESGSIVAIGDLVLTKVAHDVRRWIDVGLLPTDVRVAVNVSATEFEHPQYVERLSRVLNEAGVPAQRIELEITESLLVQDLRAAARRLSELDQLGFLIALDDFGTGYSSLSYLHSLPLHALKIDRQFVNDLRDGRSGTITRTIISMAHNLGIIAVAEGVETEAQREFLADAGCDVVQGFLYAPPLPAAAFERRLRDERSADAGRRADPGQRNPAQRNVGAGASSG